MDHAAATSPTGAAARPGDLERTGAAAARELLERTPRHPLHPEYFSSNSLFGQPGIYPGGPPMAPADGPRLDDDSARRLLGDLLGDVVDPDTVAEALAWFDEPELLERVPDAQLRAALLLLVGSPAEPVLQAFVDGTTAVTTLGTGVPESEGRVLGAPADSTDAGHRVLNERYAAEHPALIAPSLAHALCHHGERASNAEEATLHGLLGSVHAWWVSRRPELVELGTELERRQASLTITLLNARAPGSWRASIRCPDGPGTIPGGNPALQCADLWSIPFTALPDARAERSLPAPVRDSLARLAAPSADPPPGTYGEALGEWLTTSLGEGRWFGPAVRARAGRALGLL